MPTVRRFVRHFFPGLFGVNSPLPSKDSAQSTIVTWGFGRTRKLERYSQFEEDSNEMELFQDGSVPCQDSKTAENSAEGVDSAGTDVERGQEEYNKQKH